MRFAVRSRVFSVRVEPHLKRPACVPEPMNAWRRNKRDAFRSQSRVQIHTPNSFQKVLIEKPLLDPDEHGVVVLHRNHHRGLANDPVPELLWHRSKIRADPPMTISSNPPEANWFWPSACFSKAPIMFSFSPPMRSELTRAYRSTNTVPRHSTGVMFRCQSAGEPATTVHRCSVH